MKKFLFTLLLCGFSFLEVGAQVSKAGLDALRQWKPAAVVTEADICAYGLDSCFCIFPISEEIFRRMQGKSYRKGCPVSRQDLRYLHLLHRNDQGQPQLGEMVCHKQVAKTLTALFRSLYAQNYCIHLMVLVDEFDADDEKNMTANNTSCFNYRAVAGGKTLSRHSQGMALDVNPLYNPCVRLRTGKVEPRAGEPYARNRDTRKDIPCKIDTQDPCYRFLTKRGWVWGGHWRTVKDYQHFEIR